MPDITHASAAMREADRNGGSSGNEKIRLVGRQDASAVGRAWRLTGEDEERAARHVDSHRLRSLCKPRSDLVNPLEGTRNVKLALTIEHSAYVG
ncbi:MAG: hypothetical protein WKF73_06075 [Nocardioidaceae bacterium]